jgi:hypothetical protein
VDCFAVGISPSVNYFLQFLRRYHQTTHTSQKGGQYA